MRLDGTELSFSATGSPDWRVGYAVLDRVPAGARAPGGSTTSTTTPQSDATTASGESNRSAVPPLRYGPFR